MSKEELELEWFGSGELLRQIEDGRKVFIFKLLYLIFIWQELGNRYELLSKDYFENVEF